MTAGVLPGLTVLRSPTPPAVQPLRTDVAGFVGRARRGPSGSPTRVVGWDAAQQAFGRPSTGANLGWSVRGYFANGGEIACIQRVLGAGSRHATAVLGAAPSAGVPPAFDGAVMVVAVDPGLWANGTKVSLSGVRDGRALRWTWRADVPGEAVEVIGGLTTGELSEGLTRSAFLQVRVDTLAELDAVGGPRRIELSAELTGGLDGDTPTAADYRRALQALIDDPEVAMIVAPDLRDDLGTDAERVLAWSAGACDERNDRMLFDDLGRDASRVLERAEAAASSLAALIETQNRFGSRSVAAYAPWVVVDAAADNQRTVTVPATGHVAGIASRLDRERGAGRSPANANLEDLVDIAVQLQPDAASRAAGGSASAVAVNHIRCIHGRGLQVWGARTLHRGSGRFIAHRRLVHRLVRAMRRVAEPLVFETNGPELQYALRRTVTTVLLQAYRSGALLGRSPAEAFEVRCDASTTTDADVDAGRVHCIATFVPTNPIERITVRLSLGTEGHLEVAEQ